MPAKKAQSSSSSELRDAVTPLDPDAFESLLDEYDLTDEYPSLVRYLSEGFPIGPMPRITATIIQRNHVSSPSDIKIIRNDVMDDVKLGRMVGPLTKNEARGLLGGHFRTSPLSIIPKNGKPGAFRVIRDLSFRGNAGSSVNDYIPEDRPTRWVRFDEFAKQVKNAPSGAKAAHIDIRSAYRCIPTRFKHLPHLAISLPNAKTGETEIFIDRVHPFGLRSAGGNLGLAVDATIDILTHQLPGIAFWAKYVDDIVPIRHKRGVELSDILECFEYLGWPLSTEKITDFASEVKYIGFRWSFKTKSVHVPEEKRLKYVDATQKWLEDAESRGVTLKETQSIVGIVTHMSNIHEMGRAFIPSIWKFQNQLEKEVERRREGASHFFRTSPSEELINDVRVWIELLSIPDAMRSLTINPKPKDLQLWVDASDWGIAIVMGGRWRAWRLRRGWKTGSRDICWAHSVAFELAVYQLTHSGYKNATIIIHFDEQITIAQFNDGPRNTSKHTNDCIHHTVADLMTAAIDIQPKYVSAGKNRAHGPSRGRFSDFNHGARLARPFSITRPLSSLLTEV